jgi:hypothetical protein
MPMRRQHGGESAARASGVIVNLEWVIANLAHSRKRCRIGGSAGPRGRPVMSENCERVQASAAVGAAAATHTNAPPL